jgi:hypothetical protein
MLRSLFAKRLHRTLTARENEALATRAANTPDEAQERVLALEGEALAAWLIGGTVTMGTPPPNPGGRAAPARGTRTTRRRAAASKRA